ncbi:hypothetical protein Tco_0841263 [Tanacetum coccineum]|uniref:Uncharacterized protein n=1 Tax=Tanacetum coccineum TaxID=301880 RepID=A0ABQ5AVY1_9ASTR
MKIKYLSFPLRPFNRTTALGTNFSNHKVNTAGVKAVSAVGGIRKTVVKPSAGTDWKHQGLPSEYQDYNGWPCCFLRNQDPVRSEIKQTKLSPSNVFSTGGFDLNNTDQDDSQIPALEDIYDNPTDGIFTNASYDDEGASGLLTKPHINGIVVCIVSMFQVTPKTSHLNDVKRIFRYLKGKPKLGLWYPRVSSFDLEAYSDSEYAGANLDRKSATGGCQFLGRRLNSWQYKKQTIVATSTTKAEYVAAANWCGQFVDELLVRRWVVDDMMNFEVHMLHEDRVNIVGSVYTVVYMWIEIVPRCLDYEEQIAGSMDVL